MAHEHLAGLAVGNVAVLLIDDAHIDARNRAPERSRAHLARLAAVRQHAHHLGHAPDLDQREAEALLEGRMQLRLDPRADTEPHAVTALVLAGRLGEQQGRDHAQIVHDGCPRLGDLAPPELGWKRSGWIWQLPVQMAPIKDTTAALA